MHTAINNIESESGNLIKSESGNLIESESPENAGTKNSSTALRHHIKNCPDQPHLERSKLAIVNSKDGKYGLVFLKPSCQRASRWLLQDLCDNQICVLVRKS